MREYMKQRPPGIHTGKHCYIERKRDGTALKIFDAYPNVKKIDDMYWGDRQDVHKRSVNLRDATIFQNYCWWHGLAPRVYEIKKVRRKGKSYWAQVVDDAGAVSARNDKQVDHIYEQVEKVAAYYGFTRHKKDFNKNDLMGNMLVDFNTFYPTYNRKEIIKNLYAKRGRYGRIYYHDLPEFGLVNGPRNFDKRVKGYGLNQIDFKNKNVIDIGCAGGAFVRYSFDRGASKAIGVDLPEPVHAAFIAANELGYWKTDYIDKDLTKNMGGVFDIVFYLSMNFHIETPDIVKNAKMLIFEDNGKESRYKKELGKPWTDWFSKIKHVGSADDHGTKNTYHLWK